MPELVPVRVRDCACPHAPHPEGDVVLLRPTLSLRGGIAAQQDIRNSIGPDGLVDAEALVPRWMETFVRHGAAGWNLLDEAGAPVPFDIEALLADFALAGPVADAADDRYGEAVLRPLGLASATTSQRGPTAASTSRTRPSSRTRR